MLANEYNRFGSARFAEASDLAAADMLQETPDAVFVGFLGKRGIWYRGAGGLLTVGGARGGKLTTLLAYSICQGTAAQISFVILDAKGELAAISQDQTQDLKACIYWNPASLHGLPQMRINPVDYIRKDSPTLVSDVKVFCENVIVSTGSRDGAYFEGRGREFLEAIILALVELKGVLTLPDLYRVINLIPGGGEAWLSFAFEMTQTPYPVCARVEEEIAAYRDNASNGFQGILGELFRAFACLSDPLLMASVSPPYDFSFSKLREGNDQYAQVYLMPPAEFIGPWAAVIKAMFVAGMIYKSRAPSAPRQTWILDECAQLQKFPLVAKLFTYGAGIGIRPWAIYQSAEQMNATIEAGESLLTSSAALRSFFAVRDLKTARTLSGMLGSQTLEYDDEMLQARARHAKHQALKSMLADGDMMLAGIDYAHQKKEALYRSKMHRQLRTPEEVLNTPGDKQYIFSDGLECPIYADRRPYYDESFMAGRFHPNPYHPPLDRVRVKSRWRHEWRPVIREPVPARFSHLPQYRDGYWSRIAD